MPLCWQNTPQLQAVCQEFTAHPWISCWAPSAPLTQPHPPSGQSQGWGSNIWAAPWVRKVLGVVLQGRQVTSAYLSYEWGWQRERATYTGAGAAPFSALKRVQVTSNPGVSPKNNSPGQVQQYLNPTQKMAMVQTPFLHKVKGLGQR